jgi:ribosome-associated heat shock protein Hsp15
MTGTTTNPGDEARVRLDKWLWAARFFKTRSAAATAIEAGKVMLNDEQVKRSKLLRIGDVVRVRKGPYEYEVTVRELAERRGSATVAQTLYEESEASKEERALIAETLAMERSVAPQPIYKGRPTKRDRRALNRFKGGPSES